MTPKTNSPKQVRKRRLRLPSIMAGMALFAAVLTGFVTPAYGADGDPTVTGVSPSGGSTGGGETVLIKGTGFIGTAAASAVTVGGVAATSFAVISDTSIVAVVPAASAAGGAEIVVTVDSTASADGKEYKYGAPTVTGVSPAWGKPAGGEVVTISGSGFTGAAKADVVINGTAATDIWVVSDKSLVAKIPAVSASAGNVVVTRNSVVSATSTKSSFLFAAGAPTVTSLDKTNTGSSGASVGDPVVITGTNMLGVTQVNFGSVKITAAADITINNDGTTVTVNVPKGKDGPVDVTLASAAGTSITNLNTTFSYYPSKTPTITSVSSSVLNAANGGTFLVYGKGLAGVANTGVKLVCDDATPTTITSTTASAVGDTVLIVTVAGLVVDTTATAGECDLEITNAVSTADVKVATKADAMRYIVAA